MKEYVMVNSGCGVKADRREDLMFFLKGVDSHVQLRECPLFAKYANNFNIYNEHK